MAQKGEEDENLTVSKLYETLKSSSFLKQLYWDVQTCMKEKSTFKNIRNMVKNIIQEKMDVLETVTDSKADITRKTIVAEICSMTYAIDTVFSKILFIKLQRALKSEILKCVRELRDDEELSDEIASQVLNSINLKAEDSEEEPSTNSTHVPGKTEQKNVSISKGVKKIGEQNNIATNSAGQTKKVKIGTEARNKVMSKKQTSVPSTSTPSKDSPKKTVSTNAKNIEVSKADVLKIFSSEKQDSDTESEISVGQLSITSVSSVHTSDLSSFDDEISLSSEDEDGTKTKISLKDLQEICENGIPNGNKLENLLKAPKKVSTLEASKSTPESFCSQSPTSISQSPTSFTSKRIRKPNSKYSSDNVVCQSVKVKERKKQPTVPTENANEKSPSGENSSKRKRPSTESEPEPTNKVHKVDSTPEKKHVPHNGGASKNIKSSEIIKPQSSVRSLTSRKTAPVTLFSTS